MFQTIRRTIPFLAITAIVSFALLAMAQQRPGETGAPPLESGHALKLAHAPATPFGFRIISYNIRWRSGRELTQVIEWLKTMNESHVPAIVGLQEVDRRKQRSGRTNNARVLANGLGMHYAWTAPPPASGNKAREEETGVELLSPYPLTERTPIVLPHKGPGGKRRVALGATVKFGKSDLRIYSVHAETRIPVFRKIEQLRAVLDDLERFPKTMPAVVLGDFNSWEPQSPGEVRELFTTAGFTTPFTEDEPTFSRNAVFFDLELTLDWIWLRGLTAHSHGIDRNLKVSDHYPLWTVIKLESGEPQAK